MSQNCKTVNLGSKPGAKVANATFFTLLFTPHNVSHFAFVVNHANFANNWQVDN